MKIPECIDVTIIESMGMKITAATVVALVIEEAQELPARLWSLLPSWLR